MENYAQASRALVVACLLHHLDAIAATTPHVCDGLLEDKRPWARGYTTDVVRAAEAVMETLARDRRRPISENEKAIIIKRHAEIEALATELRESGSVLPDPQLRRTANVALNEAGVMFSGFNSVQKLRNTKKDRDESLHVVLATIVAELGGAEAVAAMPRAQRREAIERSLRQNYAIQRGPVIQSSLAERFILNATNLLGALGTVNHERFRSIPREGTGPLNIADAQALANRSAAGGMNSTATTASDTAKFYPDKANNLVIFVYPPGSRGSVINGEGTVRETAQGLRQALGSNPGAFVPNEIMVGTPTRGWKVSRVVETSGETSIRGLRIPYQGHLVYLEPG